MTTPGANSLPSRGEMPSAAALPPRLARGAAPSAVAFPPRVARVDSIRRENYRTASIFLDAAAPDTIPGQFAMLWLPGLDEKPFSIMGAEPLAFTIAAVGPFSRAVTSLQVGDRLWWRGPFGRGFDLTAGGGPGSPSAGDRLNAPGAGLSATGSPIMVGGGYGVAPLVFATRRFVGETGVRPRAAVGARTSEELLLLEDLAAAGAEVHAVTEDGSSGERGLVTDVVQRLASAAPVDSILACGPHGMLNAVGALAGELGVPVQLSWEAYMRCGIGICGSCEHDGLLLCADGPVLLSAGAGTPRST